MAGSKFNGKDSGGFQRCVAASATQCAIWGWTRISASGTLSGAMRAIPSVAWPVRARLRCAMVVGLASRAGQWQRQRQRHRHRQWQWPVVALFVGIRMAVLPWPATTRSVEVACLLRARVVLEFWAKQRRAADSPPTRTRSRAGRRGPRAGRNAAHRAGVGGRCRRIGHHGRRRDTDGRHILPMRTCFRVSNFSLLTVPNLKIMTLCFLGKELTNKCEGEVSDSNPRTFGSNPQ